MNEDEIAKGLNNITVGQNEIVKGLNNNTIGQTIQIALLVAILIRIW